MVARYSLIKSETSRKRNPLTYEQAVEQASRAFINYDVPMPKGLQYMDDMGLQMFTKYFLGIQSVLWNTFKDHPLKSIRGILMANAIGIENPFNIFGLGLYW